MNGAFYVGAVGLQAQQRALEVISGNIANVNTPAFKRTDVRFAEMMASRPDPEAPAAALDATSAAGVAALTALATDEAGEIRSTGAAMDLAVKGSGFVELMGPGGQTLLWRGGRLKVGTDGLLTAADSNLALKAAITVPADAASLTIGADGAVQAVTSAGASTEIGRIELVRTNAVETLQPLDGGLFQATDPAALTAGVPGEDGMGTLQQGATEQSNVDLSSQMVQLMLVQRAYGANAQVVQAADQLMGLANGLRR